MSAVLLSLALFLSGAAALVFETLWFRQAGLMLGNSVWASSLVIAAFMAGLAAGNAWSARWGRRLRRPVLAYAFLELLVGACGLGLVLLFPALTRVAAPLLSLLVSSPPLLNGTRMALAFVAMAVPAAAMGATLPVVVRALSAEMPQFGRVLGGLYGWNTLGAVAGALVGDALLVERLGVSGAGFAAASLNVLAALATAPLWKRSIPRAAEADDVAKPITPAGHRLLAAAFLAGGTLLCLEVVWFRFLLFFILASSVAFANMLAVVLLGIAAGGLLASTWLRFRRDGARHAPLVALGCGVACVVTYSRFSHLFPPEQISRGLVGDHARMFTIALALMLPVCILSGVLFTLIGDALKLEAGESSRTAGALTLFNTVGAAAGALAGGLLLLPLLGMERTLFLSCVAYGVAALLLATSGARRLPSLREPGRRLAFALAALCYLAVLALFPFGLMRNHFAKNVAARWTWAGARLVAYREGVAETLFYLRRDLLGVPVEHRLATNGFSMASTGVLGDRYMGLFACWSTAIRPDAKSALLISFGVGETAQALTDAAGLRSIDVVDISRDVLEMGRVLFPRGQYPLDDPRVRVHVEDGRFFLMTTPKRYDIITAEPPPPKHAGIVNLYTRDYFRLIHDRLAEGGVTTYWLPVYQMELREAQAITRGFCDAFPDCSLWTGGGLDWMLAGTRGLRGPVDEEAFARQWADPLLGRRLDEIGVEAPEQLGALFIGDSDFLDEWTRGVEPLEDDFPFRLGYRHAPLRGQGYFELMEPSVTRPRFESSAFIRRLWPRELRARSLSFFDLQTAINGVLLTPYRGGPLPGLQALEAVLTRSELETPVLWLMNTNPVEVRVAEQAMASGVQDPWLDRFVCPRLMADRDYRRAEECLARLQRHEARPEHVRWRVLALGLAGEKARALEGLRAGAAGWETRPEPERGEWEWLARRFGLELPPAPVPAMLAR